MYVCMYMLCMYVCMYVHYVCMYCIGVKFTDESVWLEALCVLANAYGQLKVIIDISGRKIHNI